MARELAGGDGGGGGGLEAGKIGTEQAGYSNTQRARRTRARDACMFGLVAFETGVSRASPYSRLLEG